MIALRSAIVVLGVATVLAARAHADEAKPTAGADEAKPAAPAVAGWVGEEVCAACHPDQAGTYAKSAHAAALGDASRPESRRGCEACHGPGSAHAEAGGGKGVGGLETFASSRPASARATPCLACHAGSESLHGFKRGQHALAGVTCTDCHGGHGGVGEHMLRKQTTALCTGCHLEVRAKFALVEHHKVNEGVVSCLDCHRPHGSRTLAALRGTDDRACFRCHGDLEGPWVFEHAGNVTEGCQRCHDPHGSVNRHLLLRQQVAQLCYECHTVTPPSHLQPSYRDCTRCHVAIHGSNTDPRFLEQ